MQHRGGLSRRWFALGAGMVIVSAAAQVSAARLPSWALATEAVLFSLGIAYAVTSVALQPRMLAAGPPLRLLTSMANIALTTAVLAVAAPWLPAPIPFSFAIYMTTVIAAILASDTQRRVPGPLLPALGCVVGMSLVWLRLRLTGDPDPAALLIWSGLLVGLGILIEVHWRIGRARMDSRLRHLAAVAGASHRLGRTTDVSEVTRAVLEAFVDSFPHLNWGGILRWDGDKGVLRSLPVALAPNGITTVEAGADPIGIRSGEGLAGKAFAAGEVLFRRSAQEAHADDPTRPAGQAESIQRVVGDVRSAIAVPLRDGSGALIGVVSMGSGISEYDWQDDDIVLVRGLADQAGVAMERGLLYDEQRQRAITDHLTGLPNRRELERILAQRDPTKSFSIMAIDLDNLKLINDEHGHEAGDAILRLVATVIRAGLRSVDIVARVGGDEFAALLPDTDIVAACEIADRLTRSMQGVAVPYGTAHFSAGCASGDPGADPREIWNLADEALYRAKAGGRNRVEAARGEIREVVRGGRRWGDLLPDILTNRQIGAVYQPIIGLADAHVAGFEALARPIGLTADSGVEGLFAAALRMGVTRDLDWLCRRAAIANAAALGESQLLFVNIGVPALLDPLHDVDQMLLLLEWAGRSPHQIVLELSEREAVTDMDRFQEVLRRYRDEGFRFALDDVGEGHSTIEVLAVGAPEYVKIASSLTHGSEDPGRQAAIEALATFARCNGSVLVAEGIETDAERRMMLSLGAELGQGWALGRPRQGFSAPEAPQLRVVGGG